jgi:hypothetical protein
MNTRNYKILSLTFTLMLGIVAASAATITWTGSSNTNWSTGSNWTGNAVPGQNDDVIINSGAARYPVLSANIYIRSLTMNAGTVNTNGYQFRTRRDFNLNGGTMNAYASVIRGRRLNVNGGTINVNGDRYIFSSRVSVDNGGVINNFVADLDLNCDLRLLAGTINLNDFSLIVAGLYTYQGGFINDGSNFTVDDVEMDFTGSIDLPFTTMRITQSADFINGIINTNATHLMVFDFNATVNSVSNAAHVNGPVKKEITSGNGTNVFSFPIGNGIVYAPLRISDYQQRRSQDFFVATYFKARNSNAGGSVGTGIDHVSQAEYWILDRSATTGTPTTDVNVRLSYNETNRSGVVDDAAQLRVVRWDGSQWVNQGRGNGSSTNNTLGNVITSTQVTSFSPFTLGSISSVNPLPVSMINFMAVKADNAVQVKWTTTMELNSDYFDVQKSIDGSNWNSIGRVEAAGNSNALTNYVYNDINVLAGWQYYRLIQVDQNGTETISKVVAINVNAINKLTLNLSPNPASNLLTINSNASENVDISFKIYDASGKLVVEGSENAMLVNIDISMLSEGVYLTEVNVNGEISRIKFLK